MERDEARRFRKEAFLRRLDEAITEPNEGGPDTVSPLGQLGPHLEGPFAASRTARESVWEAAERGVAGTARLISETYGGAKQNATEAFIGGGTKANGGGGRQAAQGVLRNLGLTAACTSAAGWTVLIGCDVALQIGPPVLTALWRSHQDLKVARGATGHEQAE